MVTTLHLPAELTLFQKHTDVTVKDGQNGRQRKFQLPIDKPQLTQKKERYNPELSASEEM